MISEDFKKEINTEIKEYKKACITIRAVLNLFEMAKYGNPFGPEIETYKDANNSVYRFHTENVLVGHIKVEAEFVIGIHYLNVHELASNENVHSSIRRTLEHFLSVYEREEVKLPENF